MEKMRGKTKKTIFFIVFISVLLSPAFGKLFGAGISLEGLAYAGSGTEALPYRVNRDKSNLNSLSGVIVNHIKEKKETWIFEKMSSEGDIDYAIRIDGRNIEKVEPEKEYSLEISIEGQAGQVTTLIKDLPGAVAVKLKMKGYLSNASITKITCLEEHTFNKVAVVEEGYISFAVHKGGQYIVADSGKTIGEETKSEAKAAEDGDYNNSYTEYAYKGKNSGTEEDPLTILGDLSHDFHASWKCMNTLAGYEGNSYPTEEGYSGDKVMKAMIEYRDPATGHLKASIYIDGSKWKMTTERAKGPYYIDYMLNPDEEFIDKSLLSHSLYTGQYDYRREKAVKALTTYSQSSDTELFYLSRTREFAGPLVYRLDVSKKFSPGDLIDIEYVLGCSNGDFYHGEMPSNAQLLIEEPSYSKYNTQGIVDYEGYLSFAIYNGGYFTLTKSGVIRPKVDLATKKSQATEMAQKVSAKIKGQTQMQLEQETIKEKVSKEKKAEKGILKENKPQEKTFQNNFKAQNEDGSIIAEGYIKEKDLSFIAKALNHQLGKAAVLLSKTESAVAVYDIALVKKTGVPYKLSEGEYLNITICLEGDYSLYDEAQLYIREIENDSKLTDKVFKASSKLKEDGKMYFAFYTTHLSRFVIIKTLGEEQKKIPKLTQEYKSEKTSMLTRKETEVSDPHKSYSLILIGSLLFLGGAVVMTDRMRKKQQREEEER